MRIPTEKQVDEIMGEVEKRRQILESAVQACVQGYSPALFVWGSPGLGKTHGITRCLDALTAGRWKHHTCYSTPKGLMLTLAEDPSSIHLFEDCESLLKTELSASILRAACGNPQGGERWVTYETQHETLRVKCTGAIIIVTNANLAKGSGPMQGVASRFRPMKWQMSEQEIISSILSISRKPYIKGSKSLDPKECKKVAIELVNMIGESKLQVSLDIRLFTEHALPTFLHAREMGQSNWMDVMSAKMSGVAETRQEGQAARTERLRQLALDIQAEKMTGKEKIEKWKRLTELGQAIYYRHLRGAIKK